VKVDMTAVATPEKAVTMAGVTLEVEVMDLAVNPPSCRKIM